MTVTRNDILKVLPVFNGEYELLSEDQTVEDIMRGIKRCHKEFATEYDSIAQYFVGSTPYQTCKNIFDFLRNNSFYFIEDEMSQSVRSPQAIVAMGAIEGIDCKNYALFAGGILDAINRSGVQHIPFVYRFVSDRLLDTSPNHVFIVAFPESDREIWIDPIPQVKSFNQRIHFYYHTDKKFKAMPLFKISGLGQAIEDIDFVVVEPRNNMIGFDASDALHTVSSVIPFGDVAVGIFEGILSSNNRPNPNDWMGWTPGDAKWWISHDGDSVQNEALNVISWITNRGWNDILDGDGHGVPRVTKEQLANKLQRGGYAQQAQALLAQQGGGIFSNTGTGLSTNNLFTTKNMVIGAALVFVAGNWVFKWW